MSDNTTTPKRRYPTRKRVEYAACWPMYLTPEAKSGVERVWARYTEASRARVMRALLDLAIERVEEEPALLLPYMTPQLAVQPSEAKAEAETKEDESNEDLVESLGVTTPEVCNPFKS